MLVEDGKWIMQGIDWEDPDCIHSAKELEEYVEQVGFLPLFSNGVKGFSVEEWTESTYWWSGVPDVDPWAWREIVARNKKVAYGKFFDKKVYGQRRLRIQRQLQYSDHKKDNCVNIRFIQKQELHPFL